MTDTDHRLAAWDAQEAAIRARQAQTAARGEPVPARPPGLAGFHAAVAGELPPSPIGDAMGFILVEAEHGRAVFQGRPTARFYNPNRTIHGGWIATLMDSALGCAIHTTLGPGQAHTTLEIKLNYVRALTDAVPLVRAEGRVVHVGRQVGTAEATLTDAAGRLYAHGSTTCLIFDAR